MSYRATERWDAIMNTNAEIRELNGECSSIRSGSGGDDGREVRECLERLRVWQTEILMALHGMDTFAEDARMQP
jgi:hypothetical protein